MEVPGKNGQVTIKERKKKVIENVGEQGNCFKIGHSKAVSETFMPEFKNDFCNNIMYGDIAGLQDTNGPLYDFINCFLVKKIFQLTEHV